MDDTLKLQIWNKAKTVEGFDAARYRQDPCGAWMDYAEYGDRESIYGWEIDHVYPKSLLEQKGFSESGIDNPENLRAMQWENNNSKGNDYPTYQSVFTSHENSNVRENKSLTINEDLQKKIKNLYKL